MVIEFLRSKNIKRNLETVNNKTTNLLTLKEEVVMKPYIASKLIFTLSLMVVVLITGCDNPFESNEPQSPNSSNTQIFMKVAENSSSVNSFTPNYNEEHAMALAGSLGKDMYPIKVGQKMSLVEKNLALQKDSATAIGTLTQKYEGRLIIQGSFNQPTIGIRQKVDTTIVKDFSTVITRIIKFKKVDDTGDDEKDWKVEAVSLPNGGSEGNTIQIAGIKLTSQNGTEHYIDDPNTYFFKAGKEKGGDDDEDDNNNFEIGFGNHGRDWKNLLTWYKRNQAIKLTVEVISNSSEPDFLTVTYGAGMNGNQKNKEKFDLVSTQQEGSYYRKVYERKWSTSSHATRMHAVINAFPRNVVYDTDTAVEVKTWGIPYRVK